MVISPDDGLYSIMREAESFVTCHEFCILKMIELLWLVSYMKISNPEIEDYLKGLYGPRGKVLRDMEAEAARLDFPIVGPLVGRLLYQLARMVDARKIFEMGSGFGYSAYWWALAMKAAESSGRKRRVLLTERSEANRKKGETYLKRAGLLKYARYEMGDALEILERTPDMFDVIFVDVEKKSYPEALESAVKKIRRGGLLVADNVLWSGRVAQHRRDESTLGIKEFNRRVFSAPDFAASIVPIRDGVLVAYKI
jgi:caffeoyl-CoA O-methyltransferase